MEAEAGEFDRMLRKAAEEIFGFPMSDFTYAQAALTPKLGGLGLRRRLSMPTGVHCQLARSEEAVHGGVEAAPWCRRVVPQKSASFALTSRSGSI